MHTSSFLFWGRDGGRVTMVRHQTSLPTLWMGGGDDIPTHSVLFWEREGVRVTMVRYSLPLPTKGMGGSLFLEIERLVVKSIQIPPALWAWVV